MVYNKKKNIIRMEYRTHFMQMFSHPRLLYGDKRFEKSEEGYAAYHIMQLKCLTLCTPSPFGSDEKVIY